MRRTMHLHAVSCCTAAEEALALVSASQADPFVDAMYLQLHCPALTVHKYQMDLVVLLRRP